MSDDKKSLEQAEAIDNTRKIAELEKQAGETEEKLLELKKQIRKLKAKDKHKFRSFIRRLDAVSGLYFMKMLFWIGMACVIIFLSSDVNAKAISSITYIMGIIFDMFILRRQQTNVSADTIRVVEGVSIIIYTLFAIALGIGIASAASGGTFINDLSPLMDWGLPFCGILSTGVELVNSVVEDD